MEQRGKAGSGITCRSNRSVCGGELADEDMREMVDAIQEAYLIAKKNNKKYTPKKYRKDEQSSK